MNKAINNKQLAKELHKPTQRVKVFRPVIVKGIDDTWCADLVDMSSLSKQNTGFKYILTVVDVLSKYAWAVPIGDKSASTVLNAFKSVLNTSNRHPSKLWIDEGKEFLNKQFTTFFRKNVNSDTHSIYHTYSQFHASPIERFNRTLKTRMYYKFTKYDTTRWVDMLDKLLYKYNHTIHHTTGMSPAKASTKVNDKFTHEQHLLDLQQARLDKIPNIKPKLNPGDVVRVSKLKTPFEKGYTPKWSRHRYLIDAVIYSKPPTYRLSNLDEDAGKPVAGSFYEQELQKTADQSLV